MSKLLSLKPALSLKSLHAVWWLYLALTIYNVITKIWLIYYTLQNLKLEFSASLTAVGAYSLMIAQTLVFAVLVRIILEAAAIYLVPSSNERNPDNIGIGTNSP